MVWRPTTSFDTHYHLGKRGSREGEEKGGRDTDKKSKAEREKEDRLCPPPTNGEEEGGREKEGWGEGTKNNSPTATLSCNLYADSLHFFGRPLHRHTFYAPDYHQTAPCTTQANHAGPGLPLSATANYPLLLPTNSALAYTQACTFLPSLSSLPLASLLQSFCPSPSLFFSPSQTTSHRTC